MLLNPDNGDLSLEFIQWFCMRTGAHPADDRVSETFKHFLDGRTIKLRVIPINETQRQVECWVDL